MQAQGQAAPPTCFTGGHEANYFDEIVLIAAAFALKGSCFSYLKTYNKQKVFASD